MFVLWMTVYSLWLVSFCFQRTVTFISFFIGDLLSPPYCHHSRRSYWYQLILSSLCSFIYIKHTPWSFSHPLCRHHLVLLSTMIWYNVAPHCADTLMLRNFNASKQYMWNSYNGRAVIYHFWYKIESQLAYSSRIYLLNFICSSEQRHVNWNTKRNSHRFD